MAVTTKSTPTRTRLVASIRSLIDEPISDAGLGQEIPRPRGVLLELAAKLRHVDARIVRLTDIRWTPDVLQELIMRQDFPRVAHERGEQAVLDGREMHLALANEDAPVCLIDPEAP